MSSRSITDAAGRVWACRQDNNEHYTVIQEMGRDVSILCTTATVSVPLRVTVGWKWHTMAENGLARIISEASPPPKEALR